MKRTYINRCKLIFFMAMLAPALPLASGMVVYGQNAPVHDTDALQAAYAAASGRFIENVGQLGDALFVAQLGERDVLFYRDSIVVLHYEKILRQEDMDQTERECESIMSTIITHPPGPSEPQYRRVSCSLHLFSEPTSFNPVPGGMRNEMVNYLISATTSHHYKGVATWDSLHYRDIDELYTLSFFFRDGRLRWEVKYMKRVPDAVALFIDRLQNGIDSLIGGPEIESRPAFPSAVDDGNIIYSTYLGGGKPEGITIVIPMTQDEFLLIGGTRSPDFPIAGTPFDSTFRGDTGSIYSTMVFVTRMNIATKQIIFSTYFGGTDLDGLISAIYHDGHIVLAGSTWSNDLPVTANAWQPVYRGNGDGYIAALNATGSELVFCSYIGGSGVENLKDMKIDAYGNIVITGLTDSWNYPTTPGVVQSRYGGGDDDIFVTKFNHDASELVFSTFVGGAGWDEGRSLDLTHDGDILVAGYTNSNDFPVTQDALYGSRFALDEGCVFILSPDGSNLEYSTYIAWDTHEDACAASLDENGVMTVFGITTSANLPVNESSFQKQKGEAPAHHPTSEDYYVLKYRLTNGEILSCTYLGGNERDRYPWAFISLPGGNVLVGGSGISMDYPTTAEIDPASTEDYAIQLSILNSELALLLFSIRYGGSEYSFLEHAQINNDHLILTGFTHSTDYPITSNAWQTEFRGMTDAFFTIIDLSSVLSASSPPLVPATPAIEAYPQPSGAVLRLVQQLEPAAHATVTMHDCLGRMLKRISAEAGSDGMLRVLLDVADLRPGVYDCRITSGDRSSRRMVSIVR
jgi:hypothetical protein